MKHFLLLTLFISTSTFAANPYCNDFIRIKRTMVQLDKHQVDRILPYADWMDEQYRRKDRKQMATITAKTVILLAIKRLTPLAYIFEPTRMGDGTVTGMYARSPENFARFLKLDSTSACSYLSMGGTGADTLRDITHQLWVTLDRARR